MADKFNTYIEHIEPKFWRNNAGTWRVLTALIMICIFVSCDNDSNIINKNLSEAKVLADKGEFDAAQKILIETRHLINDATSLQDKEAYENLQGQVYYSLNAIDKAKIACENALEYSKEMKDTLLILQNAFNLGLCENEYEKAAAIYEYTVAISEKHSPSMYPQALEKLAQVYIQVNEYKKAQEALDRAYNASVSVNDNVTLQQIAFTQCELWQAQGSLDMALAGFKSIPADSCSLAGKLIRANSIYSILYGRGEYEEAIEYLDSVHQFTDSIKSINGTARIDKIESEYKEQYAEQQDRYRILLFSTISIVAVMLMLLFFSHKNAELKRKQLSLINQIADLNVKIQKLNSIDNESGTYDQDQETAPFANDQMIFLLMEKFKLSKEIFQSSPQSSILKKLNMIRGLSHENKTEVKTVSEAIIGRFSDCCSNLRQACPAMTNDDCLFCAIVYNGCNREVQSVIMSASDEALRRRKSRIKQKLPQQLFSFFFT